LFARRPISPFLVTDSGFAPTTYPSGVKDWTPCGRADAGQHRHQRATAGGARENSAFCLASPHRNPFPGL